MVFCCRPVQAGPALWILHGFATGHSCAWMVCGWSLVCGFGEYQWIRGWYCWWTPLSDYHQWVWENIPWIHQTSWWAKKCDPSVDKEVSWWSPSENMTFFHTFSRATICRDEILPGLVGTCVCPSKREIPSWINQYASWGQPTWLELWDGMKIPSEMPWWPSNVRFCQD